MRLLLEEYKYEIADIILCTLVGAGLLFIWGNFIFDIFGLIFN